MYQEQPESQNKIFFLLYFGELYIYNCFGHSQKKNDTRPVNTPCIRQSSLEKQVVKMNSNVIRGMGNGRKLRAFAPRLYAVRVMTST